jgi:tripartite-type tricarboxylate transporter receptor subunit TctC
MLSGDVMSAIRLAMFSLLAAVVAAATASAATAQTFPSRPITIVVPNPPGGITDIIARTLAARLGETWKQQVIVENRPAGAGTVGIGSVAKAAPDGHTLLVAADSAFVTAPHSHGKLPYDPLNDFAPITGLGISPQALIVNPSVPAKSLMELVALGKQKPGALNYGTFGVATSGHLNIVLIESLTGAKFTPVHYRGAAPGLNDTIAGHIQMMIVSIGLVVQSWQAGKLRVLGFGSSKRIERFPEVPTLAESGLPGYEAGSWYGLVAPKGTPREIVDKLNAEARRVLEDAQTRERVLEPSFIFSIASSPDNFAERMKRDSVKWGKVIRDANIKAE